MIAVSVGGMRRVAADFGLVYAANGLVGLVFAATGPVAVVLAVATQGGLSAAQLASWIFGAFFINGAITVAMSWRNRMPLCFFWTIPGTVLVGPALQHSSFAEVVGAYYAAGLLILGLGASGLVERTTRAVPMPIVMGMVAGVFLRFGLDLVRSLHGDPAIAAPMVVAFFGLMAAPRWGRLMPPLIGALLVGGAVVAALGRLDASALGEFALVRPVVTAPAWSWAAMIELVAPLTITVLVVQNAQGFAVLQAAGHRAPVTAATVMCGVGSVASAFVGAVSTCVTGPTNALLTSSGERGRQYTAAMFTGVLAMGFGLLAPAFTGLMLATPKAYIAVLGGLAMLRVLHSAFMVSFRGPFALGALVSFLVTVADQPVWNIGGAFWGLIAGVAVALLLERGDFARQR